jgi:hypothetical protein
VFGCCGRVAHGPKKRSRNIASTMRRARKRLALELLLQTGHARANIVRMGPQHVRGGKLSMRRQKTNVRFDIPLLPDLIEELKRHATNDLAFLVSERGKPFAAASSGRSQRGRAVALLGARPAQGISGASCTQWLSVRTDGLARLKDHRRSAAIRRGSEPYRTRGERRGQNANGKVATFQPGLPNSGRKRGGFRPEKRGGDPSISDTMAGFNTPATHVKCRLSLQMFSPQWRPGAEDTAMHLTHGKVETPEYAAWCRMLKHCFTATGDHCRFLQGHRRL